MNRETSDVIRDVPESVSFAVNAHCYEAVAKLASTIGSIPALETMLFHENYPVDAVTVRQRMLGISSEDSLKIERIVQEEKLRLEKLIHDGLMRRKGWIKKPETTS